MKFDGAQAAHLLQILREAQALVSSRELKERVGPYWREAMQALRSEGYIFDEVVGNGGSRSFRLRPEEPPSVQYLTEPAPLPPIPFTVQLHGKTTRVALTADDIRALLRGEVPPTARDALVGGLMRLTEGD